MYNSETVNLSFLQDPDEKLLVSRKSLQDKTKNNVFLISCSLCPANYIDEMGKDLKSI